MSTINIYIAAADPAVDDTPEGHADVRPLLASTALNGIRVLDLTRLRSAPTRVRQFADWGADVIKIETPVDTAQLGGTRSGPDFQNLDRDKRSLTLNLTSEAGIAAFRKLAKTADVIVENFRASAKKRLGIDYDTLAADDQG